MLLFKKDDIYDDLWQEVRYIEAGEDEYTEESGEYALLLEFKNEPDTNGLINPIRRFPVIKETKNIVIYKITRRLSTIEFFAKKRNYELYGGLKIGRNSYLRNAVPILRLLSPTMVWIDGSPLGEGVVGDVPLNHLGIGAHFIKVPNARKMKLRVVDATALMRFWADDFNKWVISKKQNKWHSEKQDIGVVGLDFPSYTNDEEELRGNITQRWSEKLAFGTEQQSESNIAIKILTDR